MQIREFFLHYNNCYICDYVRTQAGKTKAKNYHKIILIRIFFPLLIKSSSPSASIGETVANCNSAKSTSTRSKA